MLPLVELVGLVGPAAAGVDVTQLERVQCPICSKAVALFDGRREPHGHRTVIYNDCKGSWRRHIPMGKALSILVAGAWFMGHSTADLKRNRFATLRACVPRWGPTKPSYAKVLMDEAAAVLAASWARLKRETRNWLWDNQHAADSLANAQAVFSHALDVPCIFTGGLNETKRDGDGDAVIDRDLPGNAGGRLLDALPFNKRKRRESYRSYYNIHGDYSGTYSGDYALKLYGELRRRGLAVRCIQKVPRPITSYPEGKSGPWDSTFTTYPNRYVPSDTYVTRAALREVFNNQHLRDWAAVVNQTITEEFNYLWAKTKAARKNRRWVTYEESIQEPAERAALIQSRQIARKYKTRADLGISNRHQDTNASKSTNTRSHAPPSAALGPEPGNESHGSDATGPPQRRRRGRQSAGQQGSARSVPPATPPVYSEIESLTLICEALDVTEISDD